MKRIDEIIKWIEVVLILLLYFVDTYKPTGIISAWFVEGIGFVSDDNKRSSLLYGQSSIRLYLTENPKFKMAMISTHLLVILGLSLSLFYFGIILLMNLDEFVKGSCVLLIAVYFSQFLLIQWGEMIPSLSFEMDSKYL